MKNGKNKNERDMIEKPQPGIRWRIKAVVTRLMKLNSVLRANAYESKTRALHRQNLSAIPTISDLRQQRRAIPLSCGCILTKGVFFFWYFSFGQAKEKYTRDEQITCAIFY